jgi:hypothetical protein
MPRMPDIGTGVRTDLLPVPHSKKNGWKLRNRSCQEQVAGPSSVLG